MKENDGRGARKRRVRQYILLCLLFLSFMILLVSISWMLLPMLMMNATSSTINQQRQMSLADTHGLDMGALRGKMSQFHQMARNRGSNNLFRKEPALLDDAEIMKQVLNAQLHLVDLYIVDEELLHSPSLSYAGVYGLFCQLDWSKHKQDPSSVPMFRDLVQQSPDCNAHEPYKLELKKVAELARHWDHAMDVQNHDSGHNGVPKVLNLTAVVFHESRCGSTLVANALAAMDPIKHRSYSESSPPAVAMKVCGEQYTHCSLEQAAQIFQDTIYIMSRSNDVQEERVFFKFQSITTKTLPVFQKAFPTTPWMFVYRDPVQVIMSHVKDDPHLSHANCVRTRIRPPKDIHDIAQRHGHRTGATELTPEEYCAAHLASITESAYRAMTSSSTPSAEMGIPLLYDDLIKVLHSSILPRLLGRPLTSTEIFNMDGISHQYSKGRNHRRGEFQGDSQQKEQAASNAVKQAAQDYLQESFDQLLHHSSKLLQLPLPK